MYYNVQISLYSDFSSLIVNAMVKDVNDYSVTKSLEPFTVYYWRVRAIEPLTGQHSKWSVPCTFRIKATDIIIHHNMDNNNSYIWYGSNCFGFNHEFIRDYDTECITPKAEIGVCLPKPGKALIGVTCDNGTLHSYCPGACVPKWDNDVVEFLLTEDEYVISTEDGVWLIL